MAFLRRAAPLFRPLSGLGAESCHCEKINSRYLLSTSSSLQSVSRSSSFLPSPLCGPTGHAQSRRFSSTPTPAMANKIALLDAISERRTFYALNKDLPISDSRVEELVKFAVKNVPSSFNSQSTRVVLLLKAEHDKFWDYVLEILRPMVPPEQFGHTEQRVGGFKAGYGTILFYEDPETVAALQKQFALYADKFPQWSEHTSAMHQYALWLALEAEGCGANLQHYNPVIDQKAASEWKIPQEWQLKAQLVFGGRAGQPGEKQFKPIDGERYFVHGK